LEIQIELPRSFLPLEKKTSCRGCRRTGGFAKVKQGDLLRGAGRAKGGGRGEQKKTFFCSHREEGGSADDFTVDTGPVKRFTQGVREGKTLVEGGRLTLSLN